MHIKLTTTITTEIDIDTFKPVHSVLIEAEDELPEDVIYAAVAGACRSTLKSLPERFQTLAEDEA